MKIRFSSRALSLRALRVILITLLVCVPAWLSLKAQTDIATDVTDPNNLRDHEPSIAVNPINPLEIVIVTFAEGWSPTLKAPIWRTIDGGRTWAKLFVLPQPDAASDGIGDQKVAFDSEGRLHVAVLAKGVSVPRCFIFRQTGAGGTDLEVGEHYGNDQPHLDVDRSTRSPFLGRLYSPWVAGPVNSRGLSNVTRSTDRGVTATDAVAGDDESPNRTTRIAIANGGFVYVIFKIRGDGLEGGFENAHFVVRRSDDGGETFDALGRSGVSVHGVEAVQTWFTLSWGNPDKGKVARARSSDAWIAADPSDGDVYAVFCDRDASGFGQIFLARSSDRGATWTNTRVTDGTHHSAYPEVAVADNGAVGVMYIDFDDSGPATIFRHRFARSFNDGSSWSHETLQSMDPGPIRNATGILWGDYEGLTAQGLTFYGVFTGQSIGRTTLQFDPIFFTRSAVTGSFCSRMPQVCDDPFKTDRNLLVLKCLVSNCRIVDPLPQNCLVKFACPGCSPLGLCPPYYNIFFEDIDPAWSVRLVDPLGRPVPLDRIKTPKGMVVSFRPRKAFFQEGKIGDYSLVFTLGRGGKVGTEYPIKTRLEVGNAPFKP